MRVTHLGQHYAALSRITGSLSDFASAQQQVSSGKRIQRPSDDPTAMARALELRAALGTSEQAARNADDGALWVNLADSKLQSTIDQLQRAKELAIRGATFTNADERAAIAAEVAQLRETVVGLANTHHQGRGLFSGFDAGDAVAEVGGTWTYQGDAGQVNRRIGDSEVVSVNVTAYEAFGFAGGKDVFTVLDDLEAALIGNDQSGIDAGINEVQASMDTVLNSLTTLGAVGARIEAAQLRIGEDIENIRAQLSSVEDVDLAEAMMEMQLQESAYTAALTAFARTGQTSLVDFLR
jgi:flagellar hook-associated protein 3 FlgL